MREQPVVQTHQVGLAGLAQTRLLDHYLIEPCQVGASCQYAYHLTLIHDWSTGDDGHLAQRKGVGGLFDVATVKAVDEEVVESEALALVAYVGGNEHGARVVHEEDLFEQTHALRRPDELALQSGVGRVVLSVDATGEGDSAQVGDHIASGQDYVEVELQLRSPGDDLLLLQREDGAQLIDHTLTGISKAQQDGDKADGQSGEDHAEYEEEQQAGHGWTGCRAEPRFSRGGGASHGVAGLNCMV